MSLIKKFIRGVFVLFFFPNMQKIVIASTGRSGSTMLFNAVSEGLIRQRFNSKLNVIVISVIRLLCAGYVDRINTLSREPCVVCKTHDIYEYPPDTKDKYVFVYGDPLESALSVEKFVQKKGLAWFKRHQNHLRGSGNYNDLYNKDVLNYRNQLQSWLTQRSQNIICIDYDDLWEEKTRLSEFLRFDVQLPPRRKRENKPERQKINQELFEQLRELKKNLKNDYLLYVRELK